MNSFLYEFKSVVIKDYKPITLSIPHGQMVSIMSEDHQFRNRFSLLCSLYELPQSGELYFNNEKVISKKRNPLVSSLEFVGLFEELSVLENIKYMAVLQGINTEVEVNRVMELMKLQKSNIPIKRCTNGIKQKTKCAIALLGFPQVLILKDLFEKVDYESYKDIMNSLLYIQFHYQVSIILVTPFSPQFKNVIHTNYLEHQKALSAYDFERLSGLYGVILVTDRNVVSKEIIQKSFPKIVLEHNIHNELIFYATNITVGEIVKVLVQEGINILKLKTLS